MAGQGRAGQGRAGQGAEEHLITGHLLEAESKALQALGVQGTNGLGKVSETGWLVQIQNRAGVVSQHPREHWPLHIVSAVLIKTQQQEMTGNTARQRLAEAHG